MSPTCVAVLVVSMLMIVAQYQSLAEPLDVLVEDRIRSQNSSNKYRIMQDATAKKLDGRPCIADFKLCDARCNRARSERTAPEHIEVAPELVEMCYDQRGNKKPCRRGPEKAVQKRANDVSPCAYKCQSSFRRCTASGKQGCSTLHYSCLTRCFDEDVITTITPSTIKTTTKSSGTSKKTGVVDYETCVSNCGVLWRRCQDDQLEELYCKRQVLRCQNRCKRSFPEKNVGRLELLVKDDVGALCRQRCSATMKECRRVIAVLNSRQRSSKCGSNKLIANMFQRFGGVNVSITFNGTLNYKRRPHMIINSVIKQ